MLGIAITALVISLIAGTLGFTGIAAGAATIAKIIFGIFIVVAYLLRADRRWDLPVHLGQELFVGVAGWRAPDQLCQPCSRRDRLLRTEISSAAESGGFVSPSMICRLVSGLP